MNLYNAVNFFISALVGICAAFLIIPAAIIFGIGYTIYYIIKAFKKSKYPYNYKNISIAKNNLTNRQERDNIKKT
jgi:hypothetical protein